MTGIEITIQVLTCSALVGLLGAVGLRLTYGEVKAALARCRFTAILLLNFALIPALAVVIVKAFALEGDVIIAMVLLAAAPFAPVVPVFARMARADLASAAALTAVFPLASALLTPLAAQVALRVSGKAGCGAVQHLDQPDDVGGHHYTAIGRGRDRKAASAGAKSMAVASGRSDFRNVGRFLARVCYRNSVWCDCRSRLASLAGDGVGE